MVNGRYIHFFKNKYNKLTPILSIYLFWPPRASKCEWNSSEWNNLLCYLLLIIYIIVTSNSKLKVCYILHPSPMNIHSAIIPPPPILLSPSSWASSKVKEKKKMWVEKKTFEYPQQSNSFCWIFRSFNMVASLSSYKLKTI